MDLRTLLQPQPSPTPDPPTPSPPATQVPATQVPATQVPATQVPATQVPATQVPATQVQVTPAQPVPGPPAPDPPVFLAPDVPAFDSDINALFARTTSLGTIHDSVATCVKFWEMLHNAYQTRNESRQEYDEKLLLAGEAAFQNWLLRKRANKHILHPNSLAARVGTAGRSSVVGIHLTYLENVLVRACSLLHGLAVPRDRMSLVEVAQHKVFYPFLWPIHSRPVSDLSHMIETAISQFMDLNQATKHIEDEVTAGPMDDLHKIIFNL